MASHELTTMYTAKAVEYLIAVGYLLLFVPFWRYLNRGAHAPQRVAARAPSRPPQSGDWFELPSRLFFHPGHAWARVDGPDTVTVGIDDFARKLLGPLAALGLPGPGQTVTQGERAWSLVVDSTPIDMLSPIDGTVVAVNDAAQASPDLVSQDPYDRGWLLKVRSPRLAANLKHLISGSLIWAWMDDFTCALRLQAGLDTAPACQDGGAPVDGLARALDRDGWDRIARQFLLTGDGGPHA
jgi:glycine cleavage system H lipoate-binding protein